MAVALRNARGVLTAVALAAVLAVSAAYLLLPQPLADPEHCDREALLRWMVIRDLSRHPPETQQTLARRLDEEFRTGFDWEAAAAQLGRSQRQQVWENVLLLLEPWFTDRVEAYFALPAAERPTYLDEILDRMQAWRGVELLRSTRSDGIDPHGEEPDFVALFQQRIERCKSRADPDEREQISQLQLALQTRWLLRTLCGDSRRPG